MPFGFKRNLPYQALARTALPFALDFDFSNQKFFYQTSTGWTNYNNVMSVPGATFARSTTALNWERNGNLVSVAANTPRISYDPASARTNLTPYSDASTSVVGQVFPASAGKLPGYSNNQAWGYLGASSHLSNISVSVTATGIEDNTPYVELQISGTPTASSTTGIYFDALTAAPLANSGETWTSSFYYKNVSTSGISAGSVGVFGRDITATGVEQTLASINLNINSYQRVSATRTLNNANTAKIVAGIQFNFTSGVAISHTYRIAMPQLEKSSSATPYIYTNNGPITVLDNCLGYMAEESRVNKCTNFNVNPVDLTNVSKTGDAASTLTVVDDFNALAVAGLTPGNGKVYKLDNSAGTALAYAAIAGTTANTNAHTLSTFVRYSGGTGLTIGLVGGPTIDTSQANNIYKRLSGTVTPTSTTQNLAIGAQAGSIVYFVLNQMEEGTAATSPIVVSGAAASRAADYLTFTGLSLDVPVTMAASALLYPVDGIVRTFVSVSNGTSTNRAGLHKQAQNRLSCNMFVGGTGYLVGIDTITYTGAQNISLAARMRPTLGKGAANNALSNTEETIGTLPTMTMIGVGTNSWGGGGNYLNGTVGRIRILSDVGNPDLQNLTS